MQEFSTEIKKYIAEKQHCLSLLEKTRNALENENFVLLDSLLGVFLGDFGEEEILNFQVEEERTIPFGEVIKGLEKTFFSIDTERREEYIKGRDKKSFETLDICFDDETEIAREFYRIKSNAVNMLEEFCVLLHNDDFETIKTRLNNKDTISFIEDDGEGCELGVLIKRLRFLKSLEWNDDN